MENKGQSITDFRLDKIESTLESSIGEINVKLDQLLTLQSDYKTEIALEKQLSTTLRERVTMLEAALAEDISKLENTTRQEAIEFKSALQTLSDTSTKIQISMAEKIGPGALAGGGVAALLTVIKHLIG
jgi:hypothetical protein